MKRSELKQLIKEVIEEIELLEIDPLIKDKSSGQWKTDVTGIKVFFDITKFNLPSLVFGTLAKVGLQGAIDKIPQSIKSRLNPDAQTKFGSGIQIMNKIVHGDLRGVNHAGFVLSDGRILDAVTEGVGFRDGTEIKQNPQNYIIFNVGGSEEKLISAYNEMQRVIKSYDVKGIARQIKEKFPKLWALINRFKNVEDKYKEDGQSQFYCSEFVANLLARLGIINVQELINAKINEELTPLDSADEIDPQQLYNLIKTKAKMLDIVPTK